MPGVKGGAGTMKETVAHPVRLFVFSGKKSNDGDNDDNTYSSNRFDPMLLFMIFRFLA